MDTEHSWDEYKPFSRKLHKFSETLQRPAFGAFLLETNAICPVEINQMYFGYRDQFKLLAERFCKVSRLKIAFFLLCFHLIILNVGFVDQRKSSLPSFYLHSLYRPGIQQLLHDFHIKNEFLADDHFFLKHSRGPTTKWIRNSAHHQKTALHTAYMNSKSIRNPLKFTLKTKTNYKAGIPYRN